jgi:polysaccharide biosynthesis protein PslG
VAIGTSIRHLVRVGAVAAALAPAAPARAEVPAGFVGTMLDGAAARPSFGPERLARELDVMQESGIETLRTVWPWHRIQPYVSWEAVPDAQRARLHDVQGLPLAVSHLDTLVGLAARRGIRVLPVTVGTPGWIVRRVNVRGSPPREFGPYATFMRALVSRYGTRGTFWDEHPEVPPLPVRWWQLWNEPHLIDYWAAPRWATGYARLVRVGARAVHRADRHAKVVLAGVTSDRVAVWDHVDQLLAEGLGPEVDMVAAHVFTGSPRLVVRALRRVRATLRGYGLGRMPIALTEWSWPSSRVARGRPHPSSWETTERGQARLVGRTLRLLGRERRRLGLRAAIHYTWASSDARGGWSQWSGLRRVEPGGRVVAKPALAAFRRAAKALGASR